MTVKEAIEVLTANVMIACDRAQFSSSCKEMVENALDMAIAAMEKQEQYEQAEAEGRLIVLPCKVGDEVWYDTWEHGIKNIGIQPHKIDRVDVSFISEVGEFLYTAIPLSQLGKTVFTSREAAEAALKEAQG